MSPRAALEAGINPLEAISRYSLSRTVGASPPDVAALLVFEELAHTTRVRMLARRCCWGCCCCRNALLLVLVPCCCARSCAVAFHSGPAPHPPALAFTHAPSNPAIQARSHPLHAGRR